MSSVRAATLLRINIATLKALQVAKRGPHVLPVKVPQGCITEKQTPSASHALRLMELLLLSQTIQIIDNATVSQIATPVFSMKQFPLRFLQIAFVHPVSIV
jgi:hypothetical protein